MHFFHLFTSIPFITLVCVDKTDEVQANCVWRRTLRWIRWRKRKKTEGYQDGRKLCSETHNLIFLAWLCILLCTKSINKGIILKKRTDYDFDYFKGISKEFWTVSHQWKLTDCCLWSGPQKLILCNLVKCMHIFFKYRYFCRIRQPWALVLFPTAIYRENLEKFSSSAYTTTRRVVV